MLGLKLNHVSKGAPGMHEGTLSTAATAVPGHQYPQCWLTLNVRVPVYLGLSSQYHGCWCPGDERSQGISSRDINYVE